jgi:hypothetical protein
MQPNFDLWEPLSNARIFSMYKMFGKLGAMCNETVLWGDVLSELAKRDSHCSREL